MADSWIEGLQKKVWYWMDHAADTPEMTPEKQRAWRERTKFENTYHAANLVAGVCSSPSVSQVRDLLKHAAEQTKKARERLKTANKLGAMSGAFADAATAIEKTSESAGDANAACDISEAVADLNNWLEDPSAPALDGAKAFDKLLGGTAQYMKKLPPPAGPFAQIFEEIRKDNFFSNMVRLTDPESDTYHGGAMRRAIDGEHAGGQ
jgi:hypothetical protein